jgi:hypothetical protein
MPVEFKASTDAAGRLIMPPEEKKRLAEWAAENPCKEVVMAVTVVPNNSKRNAYYWPHVIRPLTKAMNDKGNKFTEADVHEMMKIRFNFSATTQDLDDPEYAWYIAEVVQWASKFFQMEFEPIDK